MVFVNDIKIDLILGKFGLHNQKYKAIEELIELTLAVAHDVNGKTDRSNIVEEIADVYIMLVQLEKIYNIKESEIEEQVEYKIQRTLDG